MIFFKIAFRNVISNWRHSISALLSISASFVSLVLFDGYLDDIKSMYDDTFRHRQMLGDLIIEKPAIHEKAGSSEPWAFWFTEDEQTKIESFLKRNPEMVNERVRSLNVQGMVSNGNQSSIFLGRGYDVAEGDRIRGTGWRWNATSGLPLKADNDFGILIGRGLGRKLGCRWENKKSILKTYGGYEPIERPFECTRKDLQLSIMTADAQLNAVDVEIIGLMDGGYKDIDDRFIHMPLPAAQALMNTKDVTYYAVELTSRKHLKPFLEKFNSEMGLQIPGVKAMSWLDHPVGETFIKTMDMMAIFRNFVVVVILLISTLSVFNTLIKIIKERTREIGTLRSMGFTSAQVQKMFIYETIMLSAIGTGVGFLSALILTFGINNLKILYKAGLLSDPVLFRINFSPQAYVTAFVILVGVSLFACLISTRSSLSKRVIDNLNHA